MVELTAIEKQLIEAKADKAYEERSAVIGAMTISWLFLSFITLTAATLGLASWLNVAIGIPVSLLVLVLVPAMARYYSCWADAKKEILEMRNDV